MRAFLQNKPNRHVFATMHEPRTVAHKQIVALTACSRVSDSCYSKE
jgi:hypothetical protein